MKYTDSWERELMVQSEWDWISVQIRKSPLKFIKKSGSTSQIN